ncbi:MAG: restriction endonuclease subunit S [Anaerolineales bacterium]|nr:restriction endonuclease subunit S [Anaerolineales bacterium]
MNKYPIVPLGEVCDFVYGDGLKETDRKGGDIPVYGSNGIVGWHDEALTKGETLIIGRKGSIGEVRFSKVPCWAIDTTYFIEKTKVPCDFTWLYYTLKALDLTRLNKSAAIPGLNREDAYEQKIPLPPLTEQKRIASLLARADRLRQLRRTAHDLGDALLQSVFLEMFGHVRVNDKKWELSKFEDVCETRLGKMLDDKKQTGKHKRPYLRNFNVRWYELDLSDIAEMDFDEKDRKEFRLQYGDVLICEGGEVGRAAIWRNEMEECYFQKALHRARPNPKLANPEYIVHLLWWLAQSGGLVDATSQVTFAHLTGEKLKELVIPVPPLSLQEEFAGVVARVESLRGRMGESTRQVEGLFESLLAEAFS